VSGGSPSGEKKQHMEFMGEETKVVVGQGKGEGEVFGGKKSKVIILSGRQGDIWYLVWKSVDPSQSQGRIQEGEYHHTSESMPHA